MPALGPVALGTQLQLYPFKWLNLEERHALVFFLDWTKGPSGDWKHIKFLRSCTLRAISENIHEC